MLTPNLHSHVRLNAQSGDILEIALRESSIPKSALPTFIAVYFWIRDLNVSEPISSSFS